MKLYTVERISHRKDDSISEIQGVYSSLHNAYVAIGQEMKEDKVNTELISKTKYRIDVPEAATDGWLYPHTYHIESHMLDCDIDEDDDENDDD